MASCEDGTTTLLWKLELRGEATRARTAATEGRILEGHCLGERVVERSAMTPGRGRAVPGSLEGSYGLLGVALDSSCRVVGKGCVDVTVPPSEPLEVIVPLRDVPPGERACPPSSCRDGVCTGECVPAPEQCNGLDDDCDGRVDETIDLQTDPDNCGFCGKRCRLGCEAGACLEEARQVAAGASITCALRRVGRVFCWGANSDGQLGDGSTYETRECEDGRLGDAARFCAMGTTVRIANPGSESAELENVVDIDAGRDHACAVREDGRVLCWGDNDRGRLGDGTTISRSRAVPVFTSDSGKLEDAVAVAAGDWPSCAVHGDGSVSCWGPMGRSGATSITDVPSRDYAEPVPSLGGVTDVDVGYLGACAVTEGGAAHCWGTNDRGALGIGSTDPADGSATPVRVPGIDDAIDVAVGGRHACVVHEGGGVSCWGDNRALQLGDGASHEDCGGDCSPSPVPVTGLDDAVAVTAGTTQTCALRAGGGVTCWGSNGSGELGDGTTTPSDVPVAVAFSSEFETAVDVSAGIHGGRPHGCAVLARGIVKCWGSNWLRWGGDPPSATKWGRLGNVEQTSMMLDRSTTPLRVSGIP